MVSALRHVRPAARAVPCALALLCALAVPAAAVEVDRAELEKGKDAKIVFVNYEGPHERIESREDILEIGRALGRAIRAGAKRAGSPSRYFAVHSVSQPPSKGPALDADVLGIGIDAGVDHIRNLRLILRGYLEEAYGYSAADAGLLAEFVTVYNAVYRGNWAYFQGRYAQPALSSLTADKAGLSVRYDEWPGRALIVVPLSELGAGSLGAVETGALTEKGVVDRMRADEGKGLEPRKEMVDLKEREADEARQKAALEREAIQGEEDALAAAKAKADREKLEAAEARAEADRKAAAAAAAEKQAQAAPADEAAKARAEAAREESDEAAKAAAAEEAGAKSAEAEVEKKAEALEERKEAAAAAEERAERKEAEAKEERAGIAEDQQAAIAAEPKAAAPAGSLGVKMLGRDSDMARLVIVDPKTGKELKASAVDTIRGRSVVLSGSSVIAVAGLAGGNGAVRLIAVDAATLEMVAQGKDDVREDSLIWSDGDSFYAVAVVGGKAYLARFGKDLSRAALSAIAVHPKASPLFSGGNVVVQDEAGAAVVLKPSDLTVAK